VQGYAGKKDTDDEANAELLAADSVGLPAVVSFERNWR
jgi:hypothetical protein